MATLRAVGVEDIPSAPVRVTRTVPVRAPRPAVFGLLTGDPARWGDFCPGFDHSGRWVVQTPDHVGSRRRVRAGGLVVEETVLLHEEGSRWAFRVESAPLPLFRALAEDYRLTDTDQGCQLEWTMALWPHFAPALHRPALDAGLKVLASGMAKGLERVTQQA